MSDDYENLISAFSHWPRLRYRPMQKIRTLSIQAIYLRILHVLNFNFTLSFYVFN